MVRLFIILASVHVLAAQTCTALSASSSAVQTALTACASGGTVVIPSGSATWSSQVSATVTGPVTIQGATACTGGCSAGTAGVGLTFTDNTSITASVVSGPALVLSGCSAASVCRITDLTFTNTTGGGSAIVGALQINGTHGQVSYRVDHIHVINQSGTFLVTMGGYGLRDHVLFSGTGDYSFASSGGDFASGGYLNWQDSTNPGTNQDDITEDSNFTFNSAGDVITDGYFGCKVTIRYNQITGGALAGITHGTDSGSYRSCVLVEVYNNAMATAAANSQSPFAIRGGTILFHDNTLGGSAQFDQIGLYYFRASAADYSVTGTWGLAQAGLNWTPQVQGGSTNTLNASAYQTSHTYAANAVATLSGCNVQTSAGGTTSSSPPSCPSFGSTVTDSGGVVWQNVGGTTSAGPGGTGFLTDNETTCVSGGSCTRYFDTNGGVYPFRDQPGLVHGQTVYGCYQWNNSGAQTPASWWFTDASAAVQLNRDYFNSSPGGYAPYTYPDPLQGSTPSGGTKAGPTAQAGPRTKQ